MIASKKLKYIILALLVFTPNVYYLFTQPFSGIALNTMALQILLFVALSLLLKKWYMYLWSPFALIAPLAITYMIFFDYPISNNTFNVIFNTTINEALEFIKEIGWAFIILLTAICLTNFAGYLYILSKINQDIFSRKIKHMTLALLMVSISLAGFTFFKTDKSYDSRLRSHFFVTYPGGISYNLLRYIRNTYLKRKKWELVKNFKFGTKKKNVINRKEIHVLVIGESSRYSNWEINGYHRKTNPLLSQRKDLITYDSCFALAGITYFSVPAILTGNSAKDIKDRKVKKSLISAYKEAGFETYWVTNQYPSVLPINAREADQLLTLNKFEGLSYDEKVLEPFARIINKNQSAKKLVIIHLMGNHYSYSKRYPEAFDYFKEAGNSQQKIINQYDNSILYTDFVVDSLIEILSESRLTIASLTYISDHGEELFDTGNSYGHSENMSLPVAHIPFFVWMNKSYQVIYVDKFKQAIRHKSSPITHQYILHSMIDMGNMDYPNEKLAFSIFSREFKPDSSIKFYSVGEIVKLLD